MKTLLVTVLAVLLLSQVQAQNLFPVEIATLPVEIQEASGLEYSGPGEIWIHNDSDDEPLIYQIDEQGTLLRTIRLLNASHVDWEDMTRDASGNLYIGDFGNNLNNRNNLRVYKIPDPSTFTSDSVNAEVINFYLPDQTQFPPPKLEQNFDIESMIHYGSKLYIFTKNRGNSGRTKMYTIPDQPGSFQATLRENFHTGPWVTGAALSPDEETFVLISEGALWVFWDVTADQFLSGPNQKVVLPFTQKEGVVFLNNSEIYLVDERESNPSHGKLYQLDLSNFATSTGEHVAQSNEIKVFPQPFETEVTLFIEGGGFENFSLDLLSSDGKLVRRELGLSGNRVRIDRGDLPSGIYIYQISSDNAVRYQGQLLAK